MQWKAGSAKWLKFNFEQALEINIELISLKDAEVKNRTEHYPAGIEFQETYCLGLVHNQGRAVPGKRKHIIKHNDDKRNESIAVI